jgi:hypothetical protein
MIASAQEILKHKKSYYSQNGEDGVLEYVLSKIPEVDKWCVEFGAWDGKHLSNTWHLISERNYTGVLIEADSDKFKTLESNTKGLKTYCLNVFVDTESNKLDNILAKVPIPKDFDLLSIDIDGDDYFIWQSLTNYQPKVVIVELNSRNKPHIDHINHKGTPLVFGISGSSIKSMTELARLKGYSLISNVGCNAIYVRKDYLKIFHDRELNPQDVFLYDEFSFLELSYEDMVNLGAGRVFLKSLKAISELFKHYIIYLKFLLGIRGSVSS